jgi:hypothetical protein
VFSYDGATSTGTFDRKGPSLSWDGSSRDGVKVLGIPPESSATLCTVATTCKAMPPIDSALSLCAPGVGINSWPAPYSRVPGLLRRPVDAPWDAVPAGFLGDPVLRQVIGY